MLSFDHVSFDICSHYDTRGSPHGVMAKMLDSDFEVSKFQLHSHYYVHFRTNIVGKYMDTFPSAQLWVK